MTAYYNEFDPHAAQWLRNLIADGQIAPGHVDERSIKDVRPRDLDGFAQCHFFAGIGVWSYALRCAGWPDGVPVWTGSCPCQPFSTAGKGQGFEDERHLWPEFFRLIAARRPGLVFGEQVSGTIGRAWLDLVYDDMEGEAYTVRAVDIPAGAFGAPHRRNRQYWVADADGGRLSAGRLGRPAARHGGAVEPGRGPCEMAVSAGPGFEGLEDRERAAPAQWTAVERDGRHAGVLDDAAEPRREGRFGQEEREADAGRELEPHGPGVSRRPGPTNGFWGAADWLFCREGKWRPIEPGASPLVDGAPRGVGPSRTGRLKGYGNAIVAPQATAFVEAYLDVRFG